MKTENKNITIKDFEDKKYGEGDKAGRYTRFQTSLGWISSFEKPVIAKLKEAEESKEAVYVEITTDKNDKEKITKYLGAAVAEAETEAQPEATPKPSDAAVEGNASNELAIAACKIYAQRAGCANIVEACELVKRAVEFFE